MRASDELVPATLASEISTKLIEVNVSRGHSGARRGDFRVLVHVSPQNFRRHTGLTRAGGSRTLRSRGSVRQMHKARSAPSGRAVSAVRASWARRLC